MKKFLQGISIIGVTLLAIYLVQVFNIFEYLSIVPDDIAEETGLTAYMSILELIRTWIFESVEQLILNNQSMITCVFAIKGDEADIDHDPIIEVKDGNNTKNIDISIKIKGKKKRIAASKIRIKFPDWVDIQNVNRDTRSHIQGREWLVNLNDIVSHSNEDINLDRKYTISIIKNISDDGLSDIVRVEFDKKKICPIKCTSNTMTIRNIR